MTIKELIDVLSVFWLLVIVATCVAFIGIGFVGFIKAIRQKDI